MVYDSDDFNLMDFSEMEADTEDELLDCIMEFFRETFPEIINLHNEKEIKEKFNVNMLEEGLDNNLDAIYRLFEKGMWIPLVEDRDNFMIVGKYGNELEILYKKGEIQLKE